jgi:plastocyanin
MMKITKDTKALAITAFASAAALFTVVSTNLEAGPQQLAGNGYYGYGGAYERPAAPGYIYHAPGDQSRMQQHAQPPAHSGAANPSVQPGKTQTEANNIIVARMQFMPAAIRIKAGDEVTWINHESMPHTITSRNSGLLASERLGRGSIFTHTFKQPGTYTYYCSLHPSMTGTVIVE